MSAVALVCFALIALAVLIGVGVGIHIVASDHALFHDGEGFY